MQNGLLLPPKYNGLRWQLPPEPFLARDVTFDATHSLYSPGLLIQWRVTEPCEDVASRVMRVSRASPSRPAICRSHPTRRRTGAPDNVGDIGGKEPYSGAPADSPPAGRATGRIAAVAPRANVRLVPVAPSSPGNVRPTIASGTPPAARARWRCPPSSPR